MVRMIRNFSMLSLLSVTGVAMLAARAGSSVGTIPLMPSAECTEEVVQLKLNPVCPRDAGQTGDDFTYFEKAQNPLLTVELRSIPKNSMSAHVRMTREHFMAAATAPLPGLKAEPAPAVVEKIDLKKENLFTTQYERAVTLHYGDIDVEQMKRVLAVFVCDDTNRNGRCSDEKQSRQISLRPPVHTACGLPRQVPIAVWAGCP